MKKVLAIDYGTKRLGLAISRASLAEPLTILNHDQTLWRELKVVIEREQPDLILVGLSENEMARQTKEFIDKLKQKINLPIKLVDETLSSATVRKKLATGPMKLKKKQGPIDHYAAAVFLQEWLDLGE